jgi:hypothetical protein
MLLVPYAPLIFDSTPDCADTQQPQQTFHWRRGRFRAVRTYIGGEEAEDLLHQATEQLAF